MSRSPGRLRVPAATLAGAVLLAALAGCGARGTAQPGPAPATSSGAASSAASGAASGAASTLSSQDVATVEQAVREAGGTLDQADQALAGD